MKWFGFTFFHGFLFPNQAINLHHVFARMQKKRRRLVTISRAVLSFEYWPSVQSKFYIKVFHRCLPKVVYVFLVFHTFSWVVEFCSHIFTWFFVSTGVYPSAYKAILYMALVSADCFYFSEYFRNI